MGVGRGFSGELYSKYGWGVSQRHQSLGRILALSLSLICGVSDDTTGRGSNDKTRERQPSILVETDYDYHDTHGTATMGRQERLPCADAHGSTTPRLGRPASRRVA